MPIIRYVFAALDEEESGLFVDLLADMGQLILITPDILHLLERLRQKLTPSTFPDLPKTAMVLHDRHAAHQVVLLGSRLEQAEQQALAALTADVAGEYGQDLSDVALAFAPDVAALRRLVRQRNADEEPDDTPERSEP